MKNKKKREKCNEGGHKMTEGFVMEIKMEE